MSPLRVILFVDADSFAGTEAHVLELAAGLRDAGVAARIACPVPSELATRAAGRGVEVVRIQKRRLPDLGAIATLRRLLRSGEADVIHAHNGRTGLLATLAVRAAGRGCCVMTQHFLSPNHVGQTGIRARVTHGVHGFVNGRVARFIAIADAVRQEMLDRGDARTDRITVIRHGITEPEAARAGSGAAVRAELGLAEDTPLVVCAARLQPEKDVDVLVDAMAHVAAARPDAVCVVAGQGPLREPLDARIRARGLESRVRLLGFRADVGDVIAAGDVFVLPSRGEAFGLVLLEAMARGRPVVASDAGGPREIVENGRTGLLVRPGDAAHLGNAILRLLSDREAAREFGRRGRERFLTEFSVGRMVDATLAVYRQALQGTSVSRAAGGAGAAAPAA